MAGAAVLGRLEWRVCKVVHLITETPTVRSLALECPGWPGHLPGQHVDVRLTAEDGYQAERSYSIATPLHGERITLTIQRLPDGEVSPYLCDELMAGDELELRGPIGGYFVWEPEDAVRLLLVGGGSGIVPLMAMLRKKMQARSASPVRLLLSARSLDDMIYRQELERIAASASGVEVFRTLTRSHPADWQGYMRRVDREMLAEIAWSPSDDPLAYVCGPTAFVEAVADILVSLGYPPDCVRTERFGPTGG